MGGSGSGKRARHDLVDDYLAVDVRRLARQGWLNSPSNLSWTRNGQNLGSMSMTPNWPDDAQITFAYTCASRGAVKNIIDLTFTPCTFGGERVWFTCPSCGRGVAILYFGGGGGVACRRCYGLAYASQRADKFTSLIMRCDKIRERLGWHRGPANGMGEKPKRMRWHTFMRLVNQEGKFFSGVDGIITDQMKAIGNKKSSAH